MLWEEGGSDETEQICIARGARGIRALAHGGSGARTETTRRQRRLNGETGRGVRHNESGESGSHAGQAPARGDARQDDAYAARQRSRSEIARRRQPGGGSNAFRTPSLAHRRAIDTSVDFTSA